jgi:hypothetical protein
MAWRLEFSWSGACAEIAGMTNIFEKVVKAGELPPRLRGNLDAEAPVLVSVR